MTDLTIDERLVVLVEECAEVIHAATKCLRFGWERNEREYGINKQVLAAEIGDLLGMIDSLPLDHTVVAFNRSDKLRRVEAARRARSSEIVKVPGALTEEKMMKLHKEWDNVTPLSAIRREKSDGDD